MWRQFKGDFQTWRVEKFALRAIGIDIGAPENGRIIANPLKFLLTALTVVLVSIPMGRYVYANYKNVVAATAVLNVMIQCCITLLKMFIFYCHRKKIANLLREVETVHEVYEKPNAEESKELRSQQKWSQLIAVVYYIFGVISAVAYLLPPLITVFKSALRGATNYRLPYRGVFPYNYETPINYTLTFSCIVTSIYFHLHSVVGVDCLFLWFIFNISAHYRVMRMKLRIIGDYAGDEIVSWQVFRQKVAITFSYHRHTMKIIDQLQEVFVQILFLEVLMNCLKICFAIFQFSNTQELLPSHIFYNMISLLTISLKLIIYSFGGEKIHSESENFCTALYMLLPWHSMSPTRKRLFLLPLMASQRSITLSGYFFLADRNLLVWIFKTAGSFSALLKAMKD